MKKTEVRTLNVINTQAITPNMQRLTLGGEDLLDFPAEQEGVYIKLVFPQSDNSKPLVRTYTIIEQRYDAKENTQEIDIDFVLHAPPHGPASSLAIAATIGDKVMLTGPGAKKELNLDADWFLIAGDMTAMPAISVILKKLPANAKGYVVLEILDEADRQPLTLPENIEIHWVSPKNLALAANSCETALSQKVKSLPFLNGKSSVWLACEFSTMRNLRAYFKTECKVEKKALYASSYWKKGLAEDKHKLVKREDNSLQGDIS